MLRVDILLLAAIFAVLPQSVLAEDSLKPPDLSLNAKQIQSIDGFVAREMAREKIPGLEVGIYSRGRVLLVKGYGQANVELSVPVKAETLFQSGSVGKQFVSAAIMMLVEEGKLSLDDSISKYFLDAPATWKPILVKNLLSHTSGLAEYETVDGVGPKGAFYLRLDFTEDELVKKIEALPIEWAPGDKWAYRITNYLLLGVLIHKVTGEPYTAFLEERIFKPLGMTYTRPISDRDIVPNRAAGYEMDDDQLKNQAWVSPTFNSTADGTLYFNVLDLAKWDAALYGTQLLKPSSLDRIWTVFPLNDGKPNPRNYGFGWFLGQQKGHKLVWHGGAWQGFNCNIARYPDDNLTVVVLANLDNRHSNPATFTRVIAGLVNPELLPAKLDAITETQPDIKVALAKTLDQIVDGEDIQPHMTADMAAQVTPEQVKLVHKMVSALWPGGQLTLVQRMPFPGPPGQFIFNFRLSKGPDALLISFGLAPDGRIAWLGFSGDREYDF